MTGEVPVWVCNPQRGPGTYCTGFSTVCVAEMTDRPWDSVANPALERGMNWKLCVTSAFVAATCISTPAARASFHFMQIEQIIGGVNGDVTAQAIQLRMRFAGQNQVQASRIRVHDATGSNPITIAIFPGPVPNFATGARVLITSTNFANYTNPALVTDKVMDALIPASYLTAGSLTFEDSGGSFIYWRVSWGGASYTGSTIGSTTNDANGDFGKLTGAMQTSTLQAIRFTGAASAASTTNQADYALTAGAATFNNNAGTAFTVIGGAVADGDLDGNGQADGRDISHFVDCVLTGSTSGGACPPGDFDNSGDVDAADVAAFVTALINP